MAFAIFEKGDRVVAVEQCGNWNAVDPKTHGKVKKDFYAGDDRVEVEFGSKGVHDVRPDQIEAY